MQLANDIPSTQKLNDNVGETSWNLNLIYVSSTYLHTTRLRLLSDLCFGWEALRGFWLMCIVVWPQLSSISSHTSAVKNKIRSNQTRSYSRLDHRNSFALIFWQQDSSANFICPCESLQKLCWNWSTFLVPDKSFALSWKLKRIFREGRMLQVHC